MYFTHFPEVNRALGKPANMSDAECGTLPVYTDGRMCVSCWLPNEQEREAIAAGLPVWLGVHSGHSQPPVFVSTVKPDMPPVVYEVTQEIADALKQYASCLPSPEYMGGRPQTGAELAKADPHLRQYADGDDLYPEELYFVSSQEVQAQHLANLTAAYKLHGQPAVVAYLRPYVHFLNTPAQAAQ